jgi:hypothetical protein
VKWLSSGGTMQAYRVLYRAYCKRFSELVFKTPFHVKKISLELLNKKAAKNYYKPVKLF